MKKNNLSVISSLFICVVIIITIIFAIPKIKELYFERTRYLESDFSNIYKFDFIDHWNQVADELQLNKDVIHNIKIENLKINFKKSSEIKTLMYEVVWKDGQEFHHSSVFFNEATRKFEIRAHKINGWLQYERMILAERAFDLLDKINIFDLFIEMNANYSKQKREFISYGLAFGERGDLAFRDSDMFVLEGSKIMPFTGKLPVEASYIKTYGSVQTDEPGSETVQGDYFIFDIK